MKLSASRGGITVTLEAADTEDEILDVNDAGARINFILSREAGRISEILTVARKDHEQAKSAEVKRRGSSPGERGVERGPDQIAFAGSKQPAIEATDLSAVARADQLRDPDR